MKRRGPSLAALRAEIVARDTFLERLSAGLEARLDAFREALDGAALGEPARAALDALSGFSRELGLIAREDAVVSGDGNALIDLGATIRTMIDAHEGLIAKGGRPVVLSVSGPVLIACAPVDVELVFAELMSNAMKYGEGPIQVRVDATSARARLSIRDGGPGVAPALRRRVTGKFVRGPDARTRRGFGVGLWLVRKVARGYGGDLKLVDGAIMVDWPIPRLSYDRV